MKGDFTRSTFKREKHYRSVRLQQGRVQLDADWNEQVEIQQYIEQTENKDIIGCCGVPKEGGGFKIGAKAFLNAVHFIDHEKGWIVGNDATILCTTDGGASWLKQNPSQGVTRHLNGVDFFNDESGCIVGNDATILATNNGGDNWSKQILPEGVSVNLNCVEFIDENTGWVVGDAATILVTSDGGSTWIVQSAPNGVAANLKSVHFIDNENGWIVGDAAMVLVTSDGGSTWIAQSAPNGVTANLKSVHFVDNENGWIVGDAAIILVTNDGGSTWTKQNVPTGVTANLRAVQFISGLNGLDGWAVGDNATILFTSNGGATWTKQTVPTDVTANLQAVHFIDNTHGWIVGDAATILVKNNGGVNWNVQTVADDIVFSLTISPGRIYVDGILCELENEATYLSQPDFPNPSPIDKPEAPQIERTDLVYLDVWQRHLTALDDPEILEKALGGPDTTTRVKTIWQVKVKESVAVDNCASEIEGWPELPGGGRLTTGVIASTSTDPCTVVAGGGYQGLENHLYRVEIHKSGDLNQATFKWSRNNGAVVSAIESFVVSDDNNEIIVEYLGVDDVLALHIGDWVEVIGDETELKFEPGTLAKISKIEEIDEIDEAKWKLTLVDKDDGPVDLSSYAEQGHPKVRLWDQSGDAIPITAESIELEKGIQVSFSIEGSNSEKNFKTGDYWIFAARSIDGDVERLEKEPPHGIQHHYCRLGLLIWNSNGSATLKDCRKIFSPLTDIKQISGGDYKDYFDELRADGIVYGSDGKLGFEVKKKSALEVMYSGGIAYVGGKRFDISGGSISVHPSKTLQIVYVADDGSVKVLKKGELPDKCAPLAHVSTYNNDIKRIIDVRFDLTHLDEKVETNREQIATKRADRRQFVPFFAYTIKGLEYKNGRNKLYDFRGLDEPFSPSGITSDGESIWVANFANTGRIAKIPRYANNIDEIELINLNGRQYKTANVVYDGKYLWLTAPYEHCVIVINPSSPDEFYEIPVGSMPLSIIFDGDFVWVCNFLGHSVSVIDSSTHQIVRTESFIIRNKNNPEIISYCIPLLISFDGSHIWVITHMREEYPIQGFYCQVWKIEKPWGEKLLIKEEVTEFGNLPVSTSFDGTNIYISLLRGTIKRFDVSTNEENEILSDSDKVIIGSAFDGSVLWIRCFDPQTQESFLKKLDIHTSNFWGHICIKNIGDQISQGDLIYNNTLFDGNFVWISSNIGIYRQLI